MASQLEKWIKRNVKRLGVCRRGQEAAMAKKRKELKKARKPIKKVKRAAKKERTAPNTESDDVDRVDVRPVSQFSS
jgi:hypothetical protein